MVPPWALVTVILSSCSTGYSAAAHIEDDRPSISVPDYQIVISTTEDIENQVIVTQNSAVEFRCQGKEMMDWEVEDHHMDNDRFFLNSTVLPNEEINNYMSTLTIKTAKHSDTGKIKCRYRNSVREAILYLFVESRQILFREDVFFTQVNVDKHRPTYLGCRTSSPRVRMKVIDQREKDISHNLAKSNMRFSPQSGLWILKATLHDAGTVKCIASLDGSESKQMKYLNILDDDVGEPLRIPRISDPDPPGPEVGGSLFLTCYVEVKISTYISGVQIIWSVPSTTYQEDVDSGRIIIGDIEKSNRLGIDTRTTRNPSDDMRLITRNITVNNLRADDNGTYTCTVQSNHVPQPSSEERFVRVYRPGEIFISDFSFGGGGSLIKIKDNIEEVKWFFQVETIPSNWSSFQWLLPQGEEVPDLTLEKYSKEIDGRNVKLVIRDVSIKDMGPYPFIVTVTSPTGETQTKRTELELVVTQAPSISLSVKRHQFPFFQHLEFYTLSCMVSGHPLDQSSVSLVFYPCSHLTSCNTSLATPYSVGQLKPTDRILDPRYHHTFLSETLVQAERSGRFECRACATSGGLCTATGHLDFFLSEDKTGFGIGASTSSSPSTYDYFVEGDTVSIPCTASVYKYRGVSWVRKGVRAGRMTTAEFNSEWSHVTELRFESIQVEDEGLYTCLAEVLEGEEDSGPGRRNPDRKHVKVTVKTVEKPTVTRSNLNSSSITCLENEELDFFCDMEGRPDPQLTWFKDGIELNATLIDEDNAVEFLDNGRTLRFRVVRLKDAGIYSCQGENRGGKVVLQTELVVTDSTAKTTLALIIGGSIGAAIVLILMAVAIWKIREYQAKLRVLTAAELQLFEAGDPNSINPEMGVDEQAELLPYNRGVEFPKDRLKLGKQLGSGAFGRVLKAEATGIVAWEPTTTVAVKMVKPHADITYLKALMSELKIMAALGKHLNIVNLLGACTIDLSRRELLVIVEYCRFGNLQKYLIHHRNTFISQIDPNTGLVDFSIGRVNPCNGEEMDYPKERERYENSAHYVRSASMWEGDSSVPEGYIDMGSPTPNTETTGFSFAPAAASGDQISEEQQLGTKQQPQQQQQQNGPAAATAVTRQKSVRYTKEPYLIRSLDSSNTETTCELASDMTETTHVVTGGTERASRTYSVGSRLSRSGPGWRSNVRGDYRGQEARPITTKDLICWAYQITRGMEYLASKKVMHGDLACRNILLAADNVVKICDFGLAKDMYKTNNYHKKTDGPLPVKWLAIECLRDRIFSTQSDVWAFGIVLWEMFTLGKTPYPGIEAGERFYDMLSKGYRMPKPHFSPRDIYKTMLDCWDSDPVKRPRFTELTGIFGDFLEEGEKENYMSLGERFDNANLERRPSDDQYLAMMSPPDFQKITSGDYLREDDGYLVPNKFNNNSEVKVVISEEDGYLVPTLPATQEETSFIEVSGTEAKENKEDLQGKEEETRTLLPKQEDKDL